MTEVEILRVCVLAATFLGGALFADWHRMKRSRDRWRKLAPKRGKGGRFTRR